MEMLVLVLSLKSSILSSTSFQMGKTFWGVVSAAVEQSRRKASMVAQGDGKFVPIINAHRNETLKCTSCNEWSNITITIVCWIRVTKQAEGKRTKNVTQ